MRRNLWLMMVLGLFMSGFMLGGCGGISGSSSDDSASFEPLVLGVLSADTGNTSFRQTVTMQDSDTYEYFPGQANTWDIYDDFSLEDGGDDQFDGVMELSIGGDYFPAQDYVDLIFYNPTVGTSEGVKVAAVVAGVESNYNNTATAAIGGTYSAYLNDIHDGRLYQEVDLTGASGAVQLAWTWDINVDDGEMNMPASLKVMVRDPADGGLLATLQTTISSDSNSYSVDLSAYIDQSVIISFEISSSGDGPNLIDDISLTDATPTEYIANGDFETGDLTGWTTNSPAELQNMTSGEETLADLTVTRSFYTVPDKLWGRWVDVFKNETGAAISVTVAYDGNLGSDGNGVLYLTLGTSGMALTGWDGEEQEDPADPTSSSNDRDFAFVFGNVDNLDFTSVSAINADDGIGSIEHSYDITVAPGETVAIVSFVVMNGIDTGETATDVTATATAIDTEAKKIVDNFWDDGQYRTGMIQEQIDAIVNF